MACCIFCISQNTTPETNVSILLQWEIWLATDNIPFLALMGKLQSSSKMSASKIHPLLYIWLLNVSWTHFKGILVLIILSSSLLWAGRSRACSAVTLVAVLCICGVSYCVFYQMCEHCHRWSNQPLLAMVSSPGVLLLLTFLQNNHTFCLSFKFEHPVTVF